jgi:hypothetical protein
LHSFLENFVPETGDVARRVSFGNLWVRTPAGQWSEITQATFSADATARKGYRMDFAGGSDNQQFFLQNCGFFTDYTRIGSVFDRQPNGKIPIVDTDKLP